MIHSYKIGTIVYPSFYTALEQARIMGFGTQIKDLAGNVVFYNNGASNTHYLYDSTGAYCGTSSGLSYTSEELISGANNNNEGKMRTWLNSYVYSKAVRGDARLSNSRIRVFYKKPTDVSLNSIYNKQEVNSGSYYAVRSLSNGYNTLIGNSAKITISLSGIATNLTTNTNAYVFVGIASGSSFFECGLQLRLIGGVYKWCVFSNSTVDSFCPYTSSPVANMNAGGDVVIEVKKEAGTAVGTVLYNNTLIKTVNMSYDSQFLEGVNHEFYRSISFCPAGSNNPLLVPNLNNGEYFVGTAFKNAYIRYGLNGNYVSWLYGASFNQYAVAFNDEFIDVNPSYERVNISYKGRNGSNNLII